MIKCLVRLFPGSRGEPFLMLTILEGIILNKKIEALAEA